MASLQVCALPLGSPHDRCLRREQSSGANQAFGGDYTHSSRGVWKAGVFSAEEMFQKDTKEVKGSCHIDDGVVWLRFLARGKLDDLLWRLQELRNPRPGTVSLLAMWPP